MSVTYSVRYQAEYLAKQKLAKAVEDVGLEPGEFARDASVGFSFYVPRPKTWYGWLCAQQYVGYIKFNGDTIHIEHNYGKHAEQVKALAERLAQEWGSVEVVLR